MAKVIAIVGPTAVGKTALSIKMAQQLNGEVISGDSMQVYRHLDIGTAKVTPKEMDGVVHHLIDIRNINERFSVADFQTLANQQIKAIVAKGRLPIIVGGTGFYLQALVKNLTLGDDHFDAQSLAIRRKWHEIAKQHGNQYVWERARRLDPVAVDKIPQANLRRVIRVLEVIEKTGHKFSEQPHLSSPHDFFLVGLNTDRQVLYQRINRRVDQMVDDGLINEAHWLAINGGAQFQAGKGIGYRELFPYFAGQCSQQAAIAKIKQDSRHYAKRQLTWFKNKMDVHWFDLVSGQDCVAEIIAVTRQWLSDKG